MIEALISGKLVGAPESRTSKNGRAFVTAKMRVPAGAEVAHFVRITAFSDSACAALLALADGDALAVAGTLKVSVWSPQDGEPRPNLDLVAAQVLTVYHLERRRKAAQPKGEAVDTAPKVARSQRVAAPAEGDFGAAGDDAWLRGAP